jgi:pimeloyl-ACP methyl ester carboxylesterase
VNTVASSPFPPIIMLPGAHGSGQLFAQQMELWQGRREMLAITYPEMSTAQALADAVVDQIERHGWAEVDLIGMSLGGYLAQRILRDRPALVRRVVLANAFADPRPVQSPQRRLALETQPAEVFKQEALERLQLAPESALRDLLLAELQAQSAESIRGRTLAVQRCEVLGPCAFDPKSILIIDTDRDPLIDTSMKQHLLGLYPGARHLHVLSGGHYALLTKPAVVNPVIADHFGA